MHRDSLFLMAQVMQMDFFLSLPLPSFTYNLSPTLHHFPFRGRQEAVCPPCVLCVSER